MDVLQILVGLAQFLLVVAGSFVVLCVLASHLRFQTLTAKAGNPEREGIDPDDAFEVRIADLLGTAHRTPKPFCVIYVATHPRQMDEAELKNLLETVAARVRGVLRDTDSVAVCGRRLGVIASCPRDHAEQVVRRISSAIHAEPIRLGSGQQVAPAFSVGVSSYPEDGLRVRALVDAAVAATDAAVARGPGELEFAARHEPLPPRELEEAGPAPASLVDPLTGVLRTERIGAAVHKYAARCKDAGRDVSILVVDVDHLSRYNEHYGREAGDGVLKGLGKFLQEQVREEDLIGRLGGEEFIVVMSAPARGGLAAGQRLVAQVKRTPIRVGSRSLRISVSIGVAGSPDHGRNIRRLVRAAEAALAAAKDRGRSMCLLYDAQSMRPAPEQQKPVDVF